jgi:hypothetical protein
MFIPYIDKKSASPIRWLNAQYINMLKRHFKEFGFLEKEMNIYHSLASYKDFPMFSYNYRKKSAQQKIWLDRFHEYIKGYDLFIETDCAEDIDRARRDIKKVMQFFDKYNVRYSLKSSGSKGFHLLSPYEDFMFLKLPIYIHNKPDDDQMDLVTLFKRLALDISTVLNAPTIDTSVQDIKRVTKVAYSIDVKSGMVAYPLDDIDSFQRDMFTPHNVLKLNNHKRGLRWKNVDVEQSVREKSIRSMFSDMEIF